ncbi:MAG: hypothetical protein LC798_13020 [Chloroflexi bacterium]|nr:hypothetical protein [Chloroflexota bacterium]
MTDTATPPPWLALHSYRAFTERVIDGDTLRLRVDLGFDVALTISARLRNVDSPKLSTPEGQAARDYLIRLLKPGVPIVVGGQQLVISTGKAQSFARWIADVWLTDQTLEHPQHLGDLLVAQGHATYR